MKAVILLAIETSCDETGIAVLQRDGDIITILADAIASQVGIHALTGGVVPEVAAREHVAAFKPLLHHVLTEANTTLAALDAIAVTVGPGLQPALAVGVTAARTLSFALRKPLVPVHHLEGHVYSALFADRAESVKRKEKSEKQVQIPEAGNVFPALALIVSGGHTQLILVQDFLQYVVIGSTRDDAAGEAFDKVARLLGLGYPGGPALSTLAQEGNPTAFAFARPMLAAKNLDFSFSGLKTEVAYLWRDMPEEDRTKERANIAASFEAAVVDTLVGKTMRAVEAVKPRVVLLAGGVAANTQLRKSLRAAVDKQSASLHIAPRVLCGDNAVMIGYAGLLAHERGRHTTWRTVDAEARLPLTQVSS